MLWRIAVDGFAWSEVGQADPIGKGFLDALQSGKIGADGEAAAFQGAGLIAQQPHETLACAIGNIKKEKNLDDRMVEIFRFDWNGPIFVHAEIGWSFGNCMLEKRVHHGFTAVELQRVP